ncbi:MAG: hypothetical protein JF616_10105 [Fibrobacteres bacterium]|nr:hypothetical protein [Fibrobacterota bacterium]
MPKKLCFRLALACAVFLACASAARANALKDHLSVFFEMEPSDSVVALEQLSATTLKITVADPATGQTRALKEEIGSKPMQKLLTEANDLGLKTIHWSSADESALPPVQGTGGAGKSSASDPLSTTGPAASAHPAADSGSSPRSLSAEADAGPSPAQARKPEPGSRRSLSSQRKNRMYYIGSQTLLSTYVYGLSVPLAFDVQSTRAKVAAPMIIAPFAFGTHFWFAKNRPFEDAHAKGTSYLSLASLYASHALPFALMSWDDAEAAWKVAATATLFTYPLGIYGGYMLGDAHVDQPGRIDIESKFALGFGLLGFFSPFIYYEKVNERTQEPIIRLGLGQAVALATAGHFLADQYRSGENIPDGVNTGILDHTALGGTLGLEIAALSDAGSVRPWFGAALLGGTLGFMEGLFYYRDSYDSKERGLYNSLGALAGTMVGGGIAVLVFDGGQSDYAMKAGITSLLVGGAWAGYWITDILTMGMEDRGAARPAKWTDRLALNPFPLPEPVVLNHHVSDVRYRVPGVTFTF